MTYLPWQLLSRHASTAGRRCLLYLGCWLCIFAGLTLSDMQFGAALAAPKETPYGDWSLLCDQPPGAQSEQCSLVQSVVAEDQAEVGLVVIVMRLADNKTWLMRVIAPLGVLLPYRLGLRIDNEDVGRAEFVKCIDSGCAAETVLESDLLDKLAQGSVATFIIFRTPEQGIGVPVSLAGFAEGLAQLKK